MCAIYLLFLIVFWSFWLFCSKHFKTYSSFMGSFMFFWSSGDILEIAGNAAADEIFGFQLATIFYRSFMLFLSLWPSLTFSEDQRRWNRMLDAGEFAETDRAEEHVRVSEERVRAIIQEELASFAQRLSANDPWFCWNVFFYAFFMVFFVSKYKVI